MDANDTFISKQNKKPQTLEIHSHCHLPKTRIFSLILGWLPLLPTQVPCLWHLMLQPILPGNAGFSSLEFPFYLSVLAFTGFRAFPSVSLNFTYSPCPSFTLAPSYLPFTWGMEDLEAHTACSGLTAGSARESLLVILEGSYAVLVIKAQLHIKTNALTLIPAPQRAPTFLVHDMISQTRTF